MMSNHKPAKLSSVALGVASGVICALSMMLFAWSVMMGGTASTLVDQWSAVYPGFAATLKGGFIGGAWGFVEGFILGVIFGWIYNICLCCCASSKCCDAKDTCETKK